MSVFQKSGGNSIFAKSLLLTMVAVLTTACLNPVNFSTDQLPTIKIAGEIAIDNINSAELNIRNHTKSIDIDRIDIFQTRTVKKTNIAVNGGNVSGSSTLETEERLDARISGSPTAGTQDSVLVRPTGANIMNEITVLKYKIKVSYRKAQTIPEELKGLPDLNGEVEGFLDELPRGRCVIHIYRSGDSKIKIDIEGIDEDPNYSDYYYDSDFVMNVKSQTKVDLSGLEVNVNLPPVTINGQQIEVTFSQEILDAVNAAYSSLLASVDGVNTTLNGILTEIAAYRRFDANHGFLVVMNWAPKKAAVELTKGNFTRGLGPIKTGDTDGIMLPSSAGAYQAEVKIQDQPVVIRNAFVFNQKISYLHVYINNDAKVVADISDSPARPADAEIGYGRLRVKNSSSYEITNIVFKKKIGIGAFADYDSKEFIVQKVSPGSEYQYSSVASDKVEEGNYAVFCTLADGSIVFDGHDFYILADNVAYQQGDNVLEIKQELIKPPATTVMYTVTANGGPPVPVNSDLYTTTALSIEFSRSVSTFTFNGISMNASVGAPVKINDTMYSIPVTAVKNELASFTLTGANIDSSVHQVQIYLKDSTATPGFVPVTDVVVLNQERFTKNSAKTIQWKVVPENATNTGAFWTLGHADGNLILANIFGNTPPYGLGADGKQHTDQQGRFIVRIAWSYDYLNLAVIVPNGKAAGNRNLTLNTVGETVIDSHGNSFSITVQALEFDKEKDFVKVFRFESPEIGTPTPPAPPAPPPGPATTFQNVVLNYIGRGAGGNNNYPGGEWSVNAIEVVQRPQYLTSSKDGTQHKTVTDKGGGVLTSGDPLKGKTGVWWQANPMDELNDLFGGTSEAWIKGNWGSLNKSAGTASRNGGVSEALAAYPLPIGTAPYNDKIASIDRRTRAFAYQDGSYYKAYKANYYGETAPYHVATLYLDKAYAPVITASNGSASFAWLNEVSTDKKLNISGEQIALSLPVNIGPLWLRLRMDYSDGTVGYWHKAVGLQEWFIFDPSQPYAKDAQGNIIIDVDLYATPYMTYRK
ncbi:MAG: hypothetical protein LBU19_07870 [Treponema sp.]|jgi:hypothetical protein|nr:hypothetical protein [Treponema sp.]